jgi:hypothetical protein
VVRVAKTHLVLARFIADQRQRFKIGLCNQALG